MVQAVTTKLSKSQSSSGRKVVSKETEVKKVEKKESEKTPKTSTQTLQAAVYGIDGKEHGTVSLQEDIFGSRINKELLAQVVRVYLANQRQGTASTKTRGEVTGSTRKIYRQKGTGRARHGAIRAPIFVGGGIVFGPKPRDFELSLPKRMKKAALKSALSLKVSEKTISVVDGVEKLSGKTSEVAKLLSAMKLVNKGKKANKVLVVCTGNEDKLRQAGSNIEGLRLERANLLNTYEVLNSNHIVFVKTALDALVQHLSTGK